MNKVRINKQDKLRVIQTEVLPYELPIFISNFGFYLALKSSTTQNVIKKIIGITGKIDKLNTKSYDYNEKIKYTIPFNYKISKSQSEYRTLSIIHPRMQYLFCGFYDYYADIIVMNTNKSIFSLRHPHEIASIYNSPIAQNDINTEEEITQNPIISDFCDIENNFSYFKNAKYKLLYLFYDSYEFHRLEKRFSKLLKLDVAKCFNHIYTHSLSWAITNKSFAKKHANSFSFENEFDIYMQKSNNNETNGIAIGPELSRIFSEIIFQKIDNNVLARINELTLKLGIDYEIRRYIDDYFIFYRDDKDKENIQNIISEELEHYKLYINAAKTRNISTPFITDITIAKDNLLLYFKEFFAVLEYDNKYFHRLSSVYIKKYKSIIAHHDVTYSDINRFFFVIFRKELHKYLKSEFSKNINNLCLIIDILFFALSQNIQVRTIFLVSDIVIQICEFCKYNLIEEDVFFIKKKFADELLHIVNKNSILNLENINLLRLNKYLGIDFLFNTANIEKLIANSTELNYFQIIILLIYFEEQIEPQYELKLNGFSGKSIKNVIKKSNKDDKDYYYLIFPGNDQGIKLEIRDKEKLSNLENNGTLTHAQALEVFKKVDYSEFNRLIRDNILRIMNKETAIDDAEYTMLILDLLSCPFSFTINNQTKEEFVKSMLKKNHKILEPEINELILSVNSGQYFFTNWSNFDEEYKKQLSLKDLPSGY